jgi:HPt (histidine-containing phosphotransfer) domain-containing protein
LNNTDSNNSGATNVVDFEQLKSACDGDAVVMRELVDLYFQQADEILASLERAITGNAVGDVNHLAHKLAGSSLACGMSAVVPSLRQLEGGAKAGHLNGARELLADVNTQMVDVRRRVPDLLLQYRA